MATYPIREGKQTVPVVQVDSSGNVVGMGSASSAVVVTPGSNFNPGTGAITARALYVGTAGNVNVVMSSGQTVLFSNVQSGSVLPIVCTQVSATSTTATNMVALY
jgi:hypothetical protein